jgi:O-antigen ligase
MNSLDLEERQNQSLRPFGSFATLCVAAAWLVPNHYPPWVAAWSEALAIAGLLVLLPSITVNSPASTRVSWQLLSVATLSCIVVLVQFSIGKLLFAGDAVMASLYIGLWLTAVFVWRLLGDSSGHHDGLNVLMAAWLFAALLSVGIALVQWTGAFSLGIYGADLPPNARPFANLAQPNNFSSVCFVGLCSLLWLHQLCKLGSATLIFAAGFLLFGMVLSQSRTGWLQIGLLIAWGLTLRVRARLRISCAQLLLMGLAFAAGVLLLPLISDALLLSAGRSLDEQMRPGVRLPYWAAMLDAIGREPLMGYGWQQVGTAQQDVAPDHPAVGDYFEHAHNFVLDLLLWNGIPVGGLVVVMLSWWLIVHVRAVHDARVVWLLAVVGGVVSHGMLEFPLEYAYFLIPVGLAMGAIDGLTPAQGMTLRVPRRTLLLGTGVLTLVFVVTASDYLKAEENYRTLRLESARIGVGGIVTPAVDLHVLTQLEAFLQFARIEAQPNMQPEQVEWMRKVALRFGYPPVLYRYALAAGLNGQPEIAQLTLERICRIHSSQQCAEAQQGWTVLQSRYPQLIGIRVPKVP